jgi:hypothetical protein
MEKRRAIGDSMTAKRNGHQAKPESNELWTLLNATTAEQATTTARDLITAAQADPLSITLTVNRATGRLVIMHNAGDDTREIDIAALVDILTTATRNLQAELVRLAEARGRQAVAQEKSK